MLDDGNAPAQGLGSLGSRAVGAIVDSIIVVVLALPVYFLVLATYGTEVEPGGFQATGAPALAAIGASMVIWLGYYIALEGTWGTTVGKRVVGLRVVREDGVPMDLGTSAVRNLLRLIDGIALYIVGAIFVARSSKNQRLGDRVAGTLVVKAGSSRAAEVE